MPEASRRASLKESGRNKIDHTSIRWKERTNSQEPSSDLCDLHRYAPWRAHTHTQVHCSQVPRLDNDHDLTELQPISSSFFLPDWPSPASSENDLWELFFPCVGPRDQSQVLRLGDSFLCLLQGYLHSKC